MIDPEPLSFAQAARAASREYRREPYMSTAGGYSDGGLGVSNEGAVAFLVLTDEAETNVTHNVIWFAQPGESARAIYTLPPENALVRELRLAPDGGAIAFLASDAGSQPTLFLLERPGASDQSVRALPLKGATAAFDWTPDSAALAVVLAGEAPPEPDSVLVAPHWRHGKKEPIPSRLVRFSPHADQVEVWETGGLFLNDVVCAASGDALLVVGAPPAEHQNAFESVYVLDDATSGPQRLQTDGRFVRNAGWSLDGQRVFYRSDDVYRVCARPFAAPNEGSRWGSIAVFGDTADLGGVLALRIGNVGLDLVEIDPETGAAKILREGPVEGAHHFAVSRNGAHAAYARSSLASPPVIETARTGGLARPRAVAALPTVGSANLRVERVTWDSPNGYEAAGLLVRPPEEALHPLRPLVLCVLGGPNAVRPYANLDRDLKFPARALAAAGAAVFIPNTAGRAGGGPSLWNALREGWATQSLNDVLSALDVMEARYGLGAEGRAGLMGFSFGGAVAAYCATQTDRFRCISMADAAGPPLHVYDALAGVNVPEVERPWRHYGIDNPHDPERWRFLLTQSPMHYVRRVATPILMQNGALSPSSQRIGGWFQALRHFDVPSELALYARTNHGITEPRLNIESDGREIDWFAYWALGEEVGWIVERYGLPETAWGRVVALRASRRRAAREDLGWGRGDRLAPTAW